MLERVKQRYWDFSRRRALQGWSRSLTADRPLNEAAGCTAVFVAEEFFHADLRGFGGFGKAASSVAQHFNTRPEQGLRFAAALAQALPSVQQVEQREVHDTPVLLRPSAGDALAHLRACRERLQALRPRALLCIDWYPSYLNIAQAMPHTPLLVWIRDPRDEANWQRIAQVSGEAESRGARDTAALLALAAQKRQAMQSLMADARRSGRKVVFCAKSPWLVPRAASTYGLPDLQAHPLPTPIAAPALADDIDAQRSERPSLLFLGRLDPVKRPWLAFELAARHPGVDVLVGGQSNHPALMQRWLQRYAELPNLKLLGHVDGEHKQRLLRSCWALLNTSVHEAEPVSFMEAFAYGKPVLACHANDTEVQRFGYYAGPLPGDGLDEASLQRLDAGLAALLADPAARRRKGEAARAFVLEQHSFDRFRSALLDILRLEDIAP